MAEKEKPKIEQPEHQYGKGFEVSALSHASEKHPTWNEDAFIANADAGLFGVLDGIGGHSSGDVASRLGKQTIEKTFQKFPKNIDLEQKKEALKTALDEANAQILKQAEENPKLEGMGTTASLVTVWEGRNGERKAIIAHVGDSRVYLVRSDGKLEQITEDDSAEDPEKIKRAHEKLVDEKMDPSDLEREEYDAFVNRNQIKRALGMREMETHIYTVDIREGEKLLITSDGIHDNLTDREIEKFLSENSNLQTATKELVSASLTRSRMNRDIQLAAKPDDMSAVLVEIERQVRIPKQSERELRRGEIINVRRSSGKIESDWKISNAYEKDGKKFITVTKYTASGIPLEKDIPLEEIKKLNP